MTRPREDEVPPERLRWWSEYEECTTCWGSGRELVCIDDMCRGTGECIHGDGEIDCRDCEGRGEVYYEDDELLEARSAPDLVKPRPDTPVPSTTEEKQP